MRTLLTTAYWHSFRAATRPDRRDCDVVAFGDSSAMATELAALVVSGRKRATAGLHLAYTAENEALPREGGLFMVVDGEGRPCCICQTNQVRVGPLSSVDDSFAYDEGEGDRSRAYWLAEHVAFFTRDATRCGFTMHDHIEVVFQSFSVIWPPSLADEAVAAKE